MSIRVHIMNQKGKIYMLLHPTLKRCTSSQLLQALYSRKREDDFYDYSDFERETSPENVYNLKLNKPIRSKALYSRVPGKAGYFADADGKLYTRQQIIKDQGILENQYKDDVYSEDYINVYKLNRRDADRVRKYTTATVAKLNNYEYCLILFRSEKQFVVDRKFFKQH